MNEIVEDKLIGITIGFWKILSKVKRTKEDKKENGYHIYYNCECICGKKQKIRKTVLLNGRTTSCGCNGDRNIKGKIYGKLKAITDGYIKSDSNNNQRIWVTVECECGTIKEVLKQSLENGSTKSCGCLNYEPRPNQSGKLNHNWKPELTKEDRINNNSRGSSKGYQSFRKIVLKKYNNTCICCGYKSNKNMRVHHKNSWNWYSKGRYDPNNAVVLCPNCHDIQFIDSFHYIYGNGNNTKEQLEEYIQYKQNKNNNPPIEEVSNS